MRKVLQIKGLQKRIRDSYTLNNKSRKKWTDWPMDNFTSAKVSQN